VLAERVRVQPYSAEQFAADILTMSRGRSDADELALVVGGSFEAARWLSEHGVRWEYNLKFSTVGQLRATAPLELDPGASLAAVGGGPELMESLYASIEAAGIEVRYETSLDDFLVVDGAVRGVRVLSHGRSETLAGTVVLATGGFEANPEMRRKYLGAGWDLVAIRGSRYNTGRGLVQALALGAMPGGHWGGCHSVPTDAQIPLLGDLHLSPCSERYSYADGILVNDLGQRFVDEGEDLFTMTYTKVGAAICAQPGSIAYQVFDARSSGNLQPHYYSHGDPVTAATITELAHRLAIPARALEATVSDFNAACPADPGAESFASEAQPKGQPPKSHWAVPLDRGPFVAYKVTSGISFTYGGIVTNPQMQARHVVGDHVIDGLFAAGGVVGGLFYHDYPAAAAG
jgi:tricarballylate dehydrogenase